MIEVRISFKDVYTNRIGYVTDRLAAAGFWHSPGAVKHSWEDPPGEFIYQWIPHDEMTQTNTGGERV